MIWKVRDINNKEQEISVAFAVATLNLRVLWTAHFPLQSSERGKKKKIHIEFYLNFMLQLQDGFWTLYFGKVPKGTALSFNCKCFHYRLHSATDKPL